MKGEAIIMMKTVELTKREKSRGPLYFLQWFGHDAASKFGLLSNHLLFICLP
jgi:hypothetical protein